jgi:hypothetical protein
MWNFTKIFRRCTFLKCGYVYLFWSQIPSRDEIFLFVIVARQVLVPNSCSYAVATKGFSVKGVKWTLTSIELRLRMVEEYLNASICIYGVVLN